MGGMLISSTAQEWQGGPRGAGEAVATPSCLFPGAGIMRRNELIMRASEKPTPGSLATSSLRRHWGAKGAACTDGRTRLLSPSHGAGPSRSFNGSHGEIAGASGVRWQCRRPHYSLRRVSDTSVSLWFSAIPPALTCVFVFMCGLLLVGVAGERVRCAAMCCHALQR
jgi:hypothetical protein